MVCGVGSPLESNIAFLSSGDKALHTYCGYRPASAFYKAVVHRMAHSSYPLFGVAQVKYIFTGQGSRQLFAAFSLAISQDDAVAHIVYEGLWRS